MSKNAHYFSHDYNARSDEKVKRLIRKYGLAGYGLFWAIVEDLYNNANALRTDYDSIAFDLRADAEMVKGVINDFDLFIIQGDFFGSLSIQRRLDERFEKSEKARESAGYRWDKNKTDANALRTQFGRNAIKERKGKERKGKENKEKENKEKERKGDSTAQTSTDETATQTQTESSPAPAKSGAATKKTTRTNFVPPEIHEVAAYMAEINYPGFVQQQAEKFVNYYTAIGWVVGKAKTPMKNWKAAISNWKINQNEQHTTTTNRQPSGQPSRNGHSNEELARAVAKQHGISLVPPNG